MEKTMKEPIPLLRSKIVTMGDGAVGKTSIIQRYMGKGFDESYIPTFGAEFYTYENEYQLSNKRVKIEWNVWDIAGQSRFQAIRKKYLLNARAAIVVFDITRRTTANSIPKWINEFFKSTGREQPFVLLGNKIDLRGTDEEEVTREHGEQLARELSQQYEVDVPYIETSAKENTNLGQAFRLLASKVVNRYQPSLL